MQLGPVLVDLFFNSFHFQGCTRCGIRGVSDGRRCVCVVCVTHIRFCLVSLFVFLLFCPLYRAFRCTVSFLLCTVYGGSRKVDGFETSKARDWGFLYPLLYGTRCQLRPGIALRQAPLIPITSCLFGWIDRQVLATVAPVIAVVGLLQPLNSYVFIGDGILQGSQDFVYEVGGNIQPALSQCGPDCPVSLPT